MEPSQCQAALGLQLWRRMVKEQLDAMSSSFTARVTEIDSTTVRQRDDMGLRYTEIETHFRDQKISTTHEKRKKELTDLLQEITEGKFSPFCTDCGAPLTVEMFSNYASKKCVPCRATQGKKNNHLLNVPRPAIYLFGIYTAKEKKPKRR